MKKLVLVCLIEAALAGYSVGAMAGNDPTVFLTLDTIKNNTIYDNQQLHLDDGDRPDGLIVDNGGYLATNDKGIIRNTRIKAGGAVRIDENSRSEGLLIIEKMQLPM